MGIGELVRIAVGVSSRGYWRKLRVFNITELSNVFQRIPIASLQIGSRLLPCPLIHVVPLTASTLPASLAWLVALGLGLPIAALRVQSTAEDTSNVWEVNIAHTHCSPRGTLNRGCCAPRFRELSDEKIKLSTALYRR